MDQVVPINITPDNIATIFEKPATKYKVTNYKQVYADFLLDRKYSCMVAPIETPLTLALSLKQLDYTKIVNFITKYPTQLYLDHTNFLNHNIEILLLKRIHEPNAYTILSALFSITKEQLAPYLAYMRDYSCISPSIQSAKTIYNIYSSQGISSSKLNHQIMEYFYSDLPISDAATKKAIIDINNAFKTIKNTTQQPLTVFHGTNGEISKTYSFLSTTTDPAIARAYGKRIYVLSLKNIPYMNLQDDANCQILLPINVQVNFQFSFGNFQFCTVEYTNTRNAITSTLQSNTRTVNISNKDIISVDCIQPVKDRSIRKSTNKLFCDQDNQILKELGDKSDYTLRRAMNEMLAADIYKLFGCKTFDYNLYQNDNKYFIGSGKKNVSYTVDPEFAQAYIRTFIIDCIMANWDVANPGNIGWTDNTIIRTDVGGALAYRSRGEFKISFFQLEPPEHKFLCCNALLKKCIEFSTNMHFPQAISFEKLEQDYVNIFPMYASFIHKIIQQVESRRDWYYRNQAQVVDYILSKSAKTTAQ